MADYAGLGGRIAAVIIDHIILWIITIALSAVLGLQVLAMSVTGMMDMVAYFNSMMIYMVLSFVIWILYFTYFEGSSGQTVGKRVLGIKVVKEDGSNASYGSALVRTILRVIDVLPAAYILGLILIAATDKKQWLGDMAASTIVVKT